MSDGYTKQYAVMMPDGTLYGVKADKRATEKWYNTPSFLRDMAGISEPRPPKAQVFDTRAEAEYVLASLSEWAAQLGVTFYGAVIVERLCLPFTTGCNEEFADAVAHWLEQNGGVQ